MDCFSFFFQLENSIEFFSASIDNASKKKKKKKFDSNVECEM